MKTTRSDGQISGRTFALVAAFDVSLVMTLFVMIYFFGGMTGS